jgi:hypothetical protein
MFEYDNLDVILFKREGRRIKLIKYHDPARQRAQRVHFICVALIFILPITLHYFHSLGYSIPLGMFFFDWVYLFTFIWFALYMFFVAPRRLKRSVRRYYDKRGASGRVRLGFQSRPITLVFTFIIAWVLIVIHGFQWMPFSDHNYFVWTGFPETNSFYFYMCNEYGPATCVYTFKVFYYIGSYGYYYFWYFWFSSNHYLKISILIFINLMFAIQSLRLQHAMINMQVYRKKKGIRKGIARSFAIVDKNLLYNTTSKIKNKTTLQLSNPFLEGTDNSPFGNPREKITDWAAFLADLPVCVVNKYLSKEEKFLVKQYLENTEIRKVRDDKAAIHGNGENKSINKIDKDLTVFNKETGEFTQFSYTNFRSDFNAFKSKIERMEELKKTQSRQDSEFGEIVTDAPQRFFSETIEDTTSTTMETSIKPKLALYSNHNNLVFSWEGHYKKLFRYNPEEDDLRLYSPETFNKDFPIWKTFFGIIWMFIIAISFTMLGQYLLFYTMKHQWWLLHNWVVVGYDHIYGWKTLTARKMWGHNHYLNFGYIHSMQFGGFVYYVDAHDYYGLSGGRNIISYLYFYIKLYFSTL